MGRGAMAEVYLGQQRLLNRRVAVKVLKPELANDPAYLKRFERKAQAAAALVHANIVQIHEVGHSDGLHYIVQEYVGGLNLRQWLAGTGRRNWAGLSIMRQTAAAWRRPPTKASSTATSSRKTSCSPTPARSRSPISASPASPATPKAST